MPVAVSEAPADRLATLPHWPWHDPHDLSAPRTLGWEAIRWAHTWLIQPNGPTAGQPFRFTQDQLRFLLWWYALDDDCQWLYQHGARRLAKGSGKSPFAAVLALIEFCAPVRLARFDDRAWGGCQGRPVDMPLVQIVATAESQTANTMRMIRAFAPKGSKVVEAHQIDPGKTVYYRLPEGTLEIKTSSVTASEGAEASFVVADETEHWKPSNQGPALAATLEDNLAKSGSRMLETSNAWEPGVDCVAEATWDAWVAQEEGRLVDAAGRILYDARVAPPDTDVTDLDSWRHALQWVYGDCTWKRRGDTVDVESIVRRVGSPRADVSDSKRKYLNWPTAADDAWVTPEDWARLADPAKQVEVGERIVAFFDGSKSRDATALVACRVDDGHVFTLGVWEPHLQGAEATVDVADVDRAVTLMFDRFDVVAFWADVREWESWTLSEWPNRYADRLLVHSSPHARPAQSIAWDMRGPGRAYEFSKAAEAVREEILEQAFTHDGHPVLARHVANARVRAYKDAVGIKKESPDSVKKIDAAVCMVGARMLRRIALAASSKRARTGVVW